jgi:hypothetical protein
MPEIKEVSDQMPGYTNLGRSKLKNFIDAFMPDGWRAEIDLVTAKIIGYEGVKQ